MERDPYAPEENSPSHNRYRRLLAEFAALAAQLKVSRRWPSSPCRFPVAATAACWTRRALPIGSPCLR
jgi:hypothetical protein